MPPKHLDQVCVEDAKLGEGLAKFSEVLKSSYFYPSGSYEKCEDDAAPNAYMQTVGGKFAPYLKV